MAVSEDSLDPLLPLSAQAPLLPTTPRPPGTPKVKALPQQSPAVRRGPLSLLKSQEEGEDRKEGAAHSQMGTGEPGKGGEAVRTQRIAPGRGDIQGQ